MPRLQTLRWIQPWGTRNEAPSLVKDNVVIPWQIHWLEAPRTSTLGLARVQLSPNTDSVFLSYTLKCQNALETIGALMLLL